MCANGQNSAANDAPARPGGAVCLLNPHTKLLREDSERASVETALRDRGIDVIETTADLLPGDRIAGRPDVETVVACGGDGTVWQAINAMDVARQTLAVLPAGRGNSVARELGVASMDVAFAALDQGDTENLDAMDVTLHVNGTRRETRALNGVAFGVLAEVVTLAGQLTALGALAYPVSGLLNVSPARRYGAVCDGDALDLCHHSGIVVLNTSFLASYRPGPNVIATDGLLDMFLEPGSFVAEKISEISLVAGFSAMGLETRQIRSCRIRPDRPEALYLDGEVIPDVAAVDVRVVPGSVRAIRGSVE